MLPIRTLNLTRYFSGVAFVIVLLAVALLGFFDRQHEVAQLERLAEDRNVAMTRVFRNILANEIDQVLSAFAAQPDAAERIPPDVHRLRQQVADLIRDSDIVKLKLYTLRGDTAFSTELDQIGENKQDNPGFKSALNGLVVSELVHRDQFSASEGMRFDVDLLSSYIPVVKNGEVVAVFELYQDVTHVLMRIDRSLWQIWAIAGAVLGALYLILLLIVRHAQQVLLTHEAALEQTNRELDQRVAERTLEVEKREEHIRQLLKEQQHIFENAHVGILLLRQRKILKSNQRIADMFGYDSPADIEGQSTVILYGSHEAYLAAGKIGYAQLAEKGCADFETEMVRRDGRSIWVIQTGRPLDPEAVFDSPSIWVYTDITDRKRAEAELRIAAAAFESQESMLVTDADGIILRVNKAFTDSTGYSAEDLIGQTPRILRSGRHDAAFFEEMWDSIHRHGSWQGEIWDRRKNGEIYPKWLTISAVRDGSGKVTHYVGSHTDITERKAAEEKIRNLAFFDQLTGLPNRTLLHDRLRQAMITSERMQTYGALIFLDLDHFKALNDTLGHDYGDMLLKQVAQILTGHVRQGDTVARLGGDEFVIVLAGLQETPQEAASDVEQVCRKLLAVIKDDYHFAGSDFHCSASLGATLFLGQTASIEELLKQADLAMYKAKESGRNAFTFFDPAMGAHVLARAQMEADLRRAIQERQFVLYYQPQVEGRDRRIIGAEALIRWSHPAKGLVSPVSFIQQAEENGLILPIGAWVLETACEQLASWQDDPLLGQLTIAVNVSVQQFRQSDFVDQVIRVLERTGARPTALKLELTESMFAESVEDIIGKMSVLKRLGVGFALDDFGTGYSSLSYLSRLPLDQLKIDRSFVQDIESGNNNVAICAATISIAHGLRLGVVAEGVETEAQRYFLTAVHHCDVQQGYLYGKPVPVAEFESMVRLAASQHGGSA